MGYDAVANLDCKGFEQITVDTAVGFTTTQLRPTTGNAANQGAHAAVISVENYAIRYRMDGTDPTASVGTLLNPGDSRVIDGNNLTKFKAIKVTDNALISVEYYFLP